MSKTPKTLKTRKGVLTFPLYVPVSTFGTRYPLDGLVRPYLPRLSSAVMVSLHYAKQMTQDDEPRIPLMIDSGGFACLFSNATISRDGELGVITVSNEDGDDDVIHPYQVLEFQESYADIAFTLDFPIPPGLPADQAELRQTLTINNAKWAIKNRRRRDMPLYASVQGWSPESYQACTDSLSELPFDGIAIGGLVPRAGDPDLVEEIVVKVIESAGQRPVHVFGIGKPDLVKRLFALGVDSVDSSTYVKSAADGKLLSTGEIFTDPSPTDRLHLALCNLAYASGHPVPLSFKTRQLQGRSR